MCNCGTWARLPHQGTHDYKYPPPDHHPDCEDYKAERFVRVTYDDMHCIMEPHEAADLILGSEIHYKLMDVFITRDQFVRMHEFTGF